MDWKRKERRDNIMLLATFILVLVVWLYIFATW